MKKFPWFEKLKSKREERKRKHNTSDNTDVDSPSLDTPTPASSLRQNIGFSEPEDTALGRAPKLEEGTGAAEPRVVAQNQLKVLQPQDAPSLNHSIGSATVNIQDVQTAEKRVPEAPSVWREAYERLAEDEKKILIKACPQFRLTTREGDIQLSCSTEDLVSEISTNVETAKERRDQHHPKLKKGFDITVRILDQSKDLLASASSSNPYLAAATAVASVILPLLLLPGTEQQQAVKLLGNTTHLIAVYRWTEQNFGDIIDFRKKLLQLYEKILKAEVDLFIYFGTQNWLSRAGDSIFHKGKWNDHLESLQESDKQCQDLSEQLHENATQTWRKEETLIVKKMSDTLVQILEHARETDAIKQIRRLDVNYRRARDQNPQRFSNTCNWFLRHPDFLDWRNSREWRLLWLSADPGCGKSVLSRFLTECNAKILSNCSSERVVCYFFFKEGFQDQVFAAKAVGAILHQLVMQAPNLHPYLVESLAWRSADGIDDVNMLWELFMNMLRDPLMIHKEVVCILDALDECEAESRRDLTACLDSYFGMQGRSDRPATLLKMIVTSRPYREIESDFEDLIETVPHIRLRGEEESENIEEEIRLVIEHKVKTIGRKLGLNTTRLEMLRHRLLEASNKTYLWLELVWEYLQYIDIGRQIRRVIITTKELTLALSQMPTSIYTAYERLLDRSSDKESARTLLHMILAAQRPLTVTELFYALQIFSDETIKSYNDVDDGDDSPSEDDIRNQASILKNRCGLLIRVTPDGHVAFLHQTVREFLKPEREESDEEILASQEQKDRGRVGWRHQFYSEQSHLVMARTCLRLFALEDFAEDRIKWFQGKLLPVLSKEHRPVLVDDYLVRRPESTSTNVKDERPQAEYDRRFPMLKYSCMLFCTHLQKAGPIVLDNDWSILCRLIGRLDASFPKFVAAIGGLWDFRSSASSQGLRYIDRGELWHEHFRAETALLEEQQSTSITVNTILACWKLREGLRWSLRHFKAKAPVIFWTHLFPLATWPDVIVDDPSLLSLFLGQLNLEDALLYLSRSGIAIRRSNILASALIRIESLNGKWLSRTEPMDARDAWNAILTIVQRLPITVHSNCTGSADERYFLSIVLRLTQILNWDRVKEVGKDERQSYTGLSTLEAVWKLLNPVGQRCISAIMNHLYNCTCSSENLELMKKLPEFFASADQIINRAEPNYSPSATEREWLELWETGVLKLSED